MSEEIWVVCPKCKEMMQPPLKCGSCQFDNWKQDFCNQATDAITEQLDLIDFINIYAYCDGRTYKENLDLVAEVRRDALLEACKAICDSCYAMAKNTHITLEYNGVYQNFEHTYRYKIGTFEEFSGHEDCKATNIHKLLAADQGQGQGQGKE